MESVAISDVTMVQLRKLLQAFLKIVTTLRHWASLSWRVARFLSAEGWPLKGHASFLSNSCPVTWQLPMNSCKCCYANTSRLLISCFTGSVSQRDEGCKRDERLNEEQYWANWRHVHSCFKFQLVALLMSCSFQCFLYSDFFVFLDLVELLYFGILFEL